MAGRPEARPETDPFPTFFRRATSGAKSARVIAQGVMNARTVTSFGEFRIDAGARRLWRGDQAVQLRPKAWGLLMCLVERAGRVVTRDEIAEVVWPDVAVGDDSITKALRELRAALGDNARTTKYLETLHGVGVRFTPEETPSRNEFVVPAVPRSTRAPTVMAGRAAELSLLNDHLAHAATGERRIVFIAGDGGMGKSTLVQAFLDEAGSAARLLFGQCAERSDVADAYGPLLDALDMARAREPALEEKIGSVAPSWHGLLPGAVRAGADDPPAARMLREGALLIESMAGERTLVVVIEDAHACDAATIDLIATLARRTSQAKLLILVTFRRADAVAARHPVASLCAELESKNLASTIALALLSHEEVSTLVERRLGRTRDLGVLTDFLHMRSEGQPLFLSTLVDFLVSDESVVEVDGVWCLAAPVETLAKVVPNRLISLVDAFLARLSAEDVEMLEAAATAGAEFDARPIAHALEREPAQVEDALDALAPDGRLLRFVAEHAWADGTHGGRYAFRHQLFQAALQARVSPSRRRRIHLRIAERLETGGRGDEARITGDLAMHFAEGGNLPKAVFYLMKSAERANRRGAHRDALALLRQALALAEASPAGEKKAPRILRVLLVTAGTLMLYSGFVTPELGKVLERTTRLSEELGAVPALLMMQISVQVSDLLRSRLDRPVAAAPRLVEMAESLGVAPLYGAACGLSGWASLYAADFPAACDYFGRALALDDSPTAFDAMGTMGSIPDLRMCAFFGRACARLILGDSEGAHADHAQGCARSASGRAGDRAMALAFSAFFHLLAGDVARSAHDAAGLTRSAEEVGGELFWLLAAQIFTVLDAEEPEAGALEQAIAAYLANGYRIAVGGYRAAAASIFLARGELRAADAQLEAAASAPAEPCWEAELHRLRAELLLARGGSTDKAAELFAEAIRIAREQKAQLWEQRAAKSWSTLLPIGRGLPS